MKAIRIVLADDHNFLCTAWKMILEIDNRFEVVALATTGESAATAALVHEPDVVVMDWHMPVMDGLKATRIITCLMPQVKVLGVSGTTDPVAVRQFLDHGATGYYSKFSDVAQLRTAIEDTHAGQRWICPHVMDQFLSDPPEPVVAPRLRPLLTRKELAVARMIKEGAPAQQIARQTGITTRAVATYRSTIMRKLGLRSGSQLTTVFSSLN